MAAFGRYELLRRVGSGGMADIWKARAESPNGFLKSLAIKRILPDLVENREFLRMFADEAKLVASLQHPNVVQVIDFGHVGKHDYFIAMEYVAGVNLARLLNRAFETSKLPPELALYVVFEATKGLGHAHTRPSPVVHRDVSPQNVLLSFAGDVKITDFGIARVQSAIPRTAAGHVRGKVAYMSPEQAAADPSRPVDVRSDLFSLGILLYEMITGRRLFPGGSSIENHARVITFKEPTAEELEPVPPALRDIVRTALQGNADDRFQSAAELENELTSALGEDVFAQGKQFLASYLPRLFPDEWKSEKEEDAQLVPKTNVQISMADVDALPPEPKRRPLPPRRRDEVSVDGGAVPEPVSRGDTVISARDPAELSAMQTRMPEPSLTVTVASEDLEHTRVRDDEGDEESSRESRVSVTVASEDLASKTGLTLARPILPPPVEYVPPENSVSSATRSPARTGGTNFDEPLFPARPPPAAWIAPAILGGGILLGVPFALAIAWLVLGMLGGEEKKPAVPAPTPFAMRASPTPASVATPEPAVTDDSDSMPIVEDTPAATPVQTIAIAATPVPVRTARVERTPRTTPVPVATSDSSLVDALVADPAPAAGRLRIEASTVCDIFVDRGKRGEATPFERELSAGKHTIGFVHKASGLWLEQSYEIPAGGTLTLFVDVEQATVKLR